MTPYKQKLDYCSIRDLWTQFEPSVQYTTRRAAVDAFNSANRWKKRGISMSPLKYALCAS